MTDDAAGLIDDATAANGLSSLGTPWRAFSDQVMGGISQATVSAEIVDGRRCRRLSGDVRLENNGGFIQMALDLTADGGAFDASTFTGVRLTVRGNNEHYGCHLRTPACARPWQSYRAGFFAHSDWRTVELPFVAFEPHRLGEPLETARLRRLGLVAIGRAFNADLAVSHVSLYR